MMIITLMSVDDNDDSNTYKNRNILIVIVTEIVILIRKIRVQNSDWGLNGCGKERQKTTVSVNCPFI